MTFRLRIYICCRQFKRTNSYLIQIEWRGQKKKKIAVLPAFSFLCMRCVWGCKGNLFWPGNFKEEKGLLWGAHFYIHWGGLSATESGGTGAYRGLPLGWQRNNCPSQPWWIISRPGLWPLCPHVVGCVYSQTSGWGQGTGVPTQASAFAVSYDPQSLLFLPSLSPPASSHLIIIFEILSNDCTISPGMEIMLSGFNLLSWQQPAERLLCGRQPTWTQAAEVYEI